MKKQKLEQENEKFEIMPDVEEEIKKKRGSDNKLLKLLKNKFVLFGFLFFLMVLSSFFMLLADEKNRFRPASWNTEFFKTLGKIFMPGAQYLNITISAWFLLILFWFVVFAVFGIFFLYKPAKSNYSKKHKIVENDENKKPKYGKFNALYFCLYFLAVAIFCVVYFLIFPYNELNFADAGKVLVNVLQGIGLFIIMFLFIPLCIGVIILLFKLIVMLLSLIVSNISKSIMSSQDYQEAYSASQLAAAKIKKEVEKESEAAKAAAKGEGTNGAGAQPAAAPLDGSKTGAALAVSTSNPNASNLGGHQLVMFPALSRIDRYFYKKEMPEAPTTKIDLVHLVNGFQSYLANQKSLYFDLNTLRGFVGGLACSRLILLQGLSGTGKTSLPREFAAYTYASATFYPVQATWRDKSDLVGYFSDFTGEYKETELLKTIYLAGYTPNVNYLLVLDEANISRVEYYFADFLSVYEYPSENWLIPLVQPRKEDKVPLKLKQGKLRIPVNTWFVATVNIDDSTFTISDKVYDRSMVLDFSALNEPIKPKYDDKPYPVTKPQLEEAFARAKENAKNCLNPAERNKFMKLINFVSDTFDCKIGNRVMNQIETFVPVFVACGGTKEAALDIMFANKVLRKVDSLFESYVADGLNKMAKLVSTTYGPKSFPVTNRAINKMKKKFN